MPLASQKYYADCKDLVEGLGYSLVELRVIPNNSQFQVRAVITHKVLPTSSDVSIGINDCTKVHRLLLPLFEGLLNSTDVFMEVTSPGMERGIKNAAEFVLFLGRNIKVWDTTTADWVSGVLTESNIDSLKLKVLQSGEEKSLAYENITKAKLLYMEG